MAGTKTKAAKKRKSQKDDAEAKAAKDDTFEENAAKVEQVVIPAPNLKGFSWMIEGDAPYVQNKFSEKARGEMIATQKAGTQTAKGKKKDPKDFKQCYLGALHVDKSGHYGIPANAFRQALISACRLVNFKMTIGKLALFIHADGFDKDDGTPLVRITKGKPRQVEHAVRLPNGSADIRVRPMWDEGWQAKVRIRYDADIFSATDVGNLLMRVGLQVGVGEGRPDSKKSAGMGWGTFQLQLAS